MLVPSYNASGGDPVIFYGVTAGILAGAVAGDHASPISDTTILSAMASECQILQHVRTQAPYALMVAIWSVLGELLCVKIITLAQFLERK